MELEICLFNSLRKYRSGEAIFRAVLPEGTTVGELLHHLALPVHEIYVAFRNGMSITHELGQKLALDTVLAPGDRVAFSGPVPFSRGYGAPVV